MLAAAALIGLAAPAHAAPQTHCVDPDRPGECFATIAEALDAAAVGDTVKVAALTETDPVVVAKNVTLEGAGEGKTVLAGGLTVSDPNATAMTLRTAGLDLAGIATQVRVSGTAQLRDGAILRAAEVDGRLAGATARVMSVLVRSAGGAALEACDGDLETRNVTVLGTGDVGAAACAGATLLLRDAIVWGAFAAAVDGDVTVDHAIAGGPDPRLDADGRPAADSPAIDAGTSGPLVVSKNRSVDEWFEDRAGVPRALDGDGDGVATRDLGAFERPPAPVVAPAGNLLADPGAEDGGAWALGGGFEVVRYGTTYAVPPVVPSATTGAALGAGAAFFAGGPAAESTAAQRVDVSGFAPEIDNGHATARLAGLLGGYRADADAGTLTATFLGPGDVELGTVVLTAPTPAERANAATLLPRERTDAVPRLTRAIVVGLHALLVNGNYDDATFDNLALTVDAPGAPPPKPINGPTLKPFSGVVVLTARPRIDRFGRIVTRMGCADATVGHCSGVVTVTRGVEKQRLGIVGLTLRPGSTRAVKIRLTPGARHTLRKRRRLAVALYLAVRDAQGVTETKTVPIVVLPRKKG